MSSKRRIHVSPLFVANKTSTEAFAVSFSMLMISCRIGRLNKTVLEREASIIELTASNSMKDSRILEGNER